MYRLAPATNYGGVAVWPTGDPGPSGSFATTWRKNWRPGVNALAVDGVVGPTTKDEFGNTYPARIDGTTVPALGTTATPVTISWDTVNGWQSTLSGGTALSGVLSSTYLTTEAGLSTLKNVSVMGRIIIDGAYNQVKGDQTINATPATLSVQANALNSHNRAVVGAGFPGIASSGTGPGPAGYFYAVVGFVLCTFQYATTNTLVNCSSVDGQSHLMFSGTQAVYANSLTNANSALRGRNLWVNSPYSPATKTQTQLNGAFTISAVPAAVQVAAANDITVGTSPATIVTQSSTGAFTTTGTILVGNDFVAYTGKGATSFTGCTWPVGGATATWFGVSGSGSNQIGYYCFQVDGLTIPLKSTAGFPSAPGVIEIDACVEVHYQGISGNSLTGCAVACRWSRQARVFPDGTDVRTCAGAAFVESSDAGNSWGGLFVEGASFDVRDCFMGYGGKGPGAFHFYGCNGSKLQHSYVEFNWYDVAHMLDDCGQLNLRYNVFVTHPGTGNSGAGHVDGLQGWHWTQLDGTPVCQDSAFLGSILNSHEFVNSEGGGTSISNSNLPFPSGIYYQNCLLGGSPAGTTGGKGGLMDGSQSCGAKQSYYGSDLLTAKPYGPTTTTVTNGAVTAGATSVTVVDASGFTTGAPSTTLTGDTTITRDTTFAQILSSLVLTSATAFPTGAICVFVLDDGSKQCALRADYRTTNTLNNIRWLNGTAGTYTAAGTTVYLGTGAGMVQLTTDAQTRVQVCRFTGISTNTLTGVQCLEYAVPDGAFANPMDSSHPPPVLIVDVGNQVR